MIKKVFTLLLTTLSLFLITACEEVPNVYTEEDIYNNIVVFLDEGDRFDQVTTDFTLANKVFNLYDITWTSLSDLLLIDENNVFITRTSSNELVSITGSVDFKGILVERTYELTLLNLEDEEEINVLEILEGINLNINNNLAFDKIINNFLLDDIVLTYDITWTSNNDAITIIDNQAIINRSESDQNVVLTALITINDIVYHKEFNLVVLKLEDENTVVTTYNENFSTLINHRNQNYPEPNSQYLSESEVVLNGISYDFVNYRTDAGLNLNGPKVITIGGYEDIPGEKGRGYIRGNNITDGISNLRFFGRLPFSPESTYPQGEGNDTASNSKITLYVYKNDLLLYKETKQFTNNTTANKGELFEFNDINVSGLFTYELEIDSGHRLSVESITWQNYPSEELELELITRIDFYRLLENEYYSGLIELNDNNYLVNHFRSDYTNIHIDKELPYITPLNEKDIGRFKPDYYDAAYIYNETHFEKVTKLEFMARNFGANDEYQNYGIIKVYYQLLESDDWILIDQDFELSLEFNTYSVNINKENVRVKIEMSYDETSLYGSTVNLDNITFYK
ncbi:MAG TPA: hypothetical protein GX695_01025 [Acholeplasmataceae bacterium]|nr:hypothetical protein [Acholeplasmataceae bacterium]